MPATSSRETPFIRFEGVRKEYADGTVAVPELDLTVREHELLTLVGPSGSGKSTLVRMVNRLVEPSAGQVLLDGQDVADQDPVQLRRGIGYVIQDVGLFPHRTVAQNVATVPRLLRWEPARARDRVAELLELVGLDPAVHGRRYPHELSGGQRQRVGVARALATKPRVMLMDEPFGAVDPEGRRTLQSEFRQIHDELGTTVVLVTHDIDEAVTLGDRVAVLRQGGHLEQVATPVTLLTRPASAFVEDFIGGSRVVRLLALTTLRHEDVRPAATPVPGAADAAGTVRLGERLDRAFAALVAGDDGAVPVLDEHGSPVGTLTFDGLYSALRRAYVSEGADAAEPGAREPDSDRV